MASFIIDGVEVPFEKGETIMQAADRAGVFIPRFCYHPSKEVGIEGNCRICLVEIEGMPKLQIACKTMPREGMVVKTNTPQVKKAREGVMEFLLVNHPLDCPICDQSGECDLQNYSYLYGRDRSRYREEKLSKPKHKIIGPHIILDSERCILCGRCVRFLKNFTKTGELGFTQRGAKNVLDIAPGLKLDNNYSGNVAQLCPVGALTSRDFRFKARVWQLDKNDSICPECSTGCNITVEAIGGKIYKLDYHVYRINARPNNAVNGYWICDIGRFGYHWLNSEDRLRAPMVKHGEHQDTLRTAAAVEQASARLKKIKDSYGTSAIAGIGSARVTNEENYLLKKLITEVLGSPNLDFVGCHGDVGEMEDNLLLRKDKNPNSKGCQDLGMAPLQGGKDLDGILKGVNDGSIKGLVVLAVGNKMPADIRKKIASALANAEFGLLIDCMKSELSASADLVLASLAYAETAGTYTNYAGRVQRLMPTPVPQRGEARQGWELLRDVIVKLGVPVRYSTAWAVTEELLGAVPVYKGIALNDIGSQGAQGGKEK